MKTLYHHTRRLASEYEIKFFITAYGLVLLMTALALGFSEKEIILPELAALSIGCFKYKKNELTQNPMLLSLLPAMTAFMGFFINQLDIELAAKIVLVLMAMFLLLYLAKSNLAPALATGLLPIITNCRSYIFLVSVVVFMGILGLLVAVIFRTKDTQQDSSGEERHVLSSLMLLAVLVLWTLVCYTAGVVQMAAIPPVIVVGYESIGKRHYSFKMLCKQVSALVLAAFIGAQNIYYLDNYLLATVINFIAVALLVHFFKLKMSPLYAMVMLPIVLPGFSHISFGPTVAVSSIAVLGSIYILINKTSVLAL